MDVFLDLKNDFVDLIRFLGVLFGQPLEVTTDSAASRSVLSCLDLEICAFDHHGLEDDQGIPFTRYNVEIDLRRLNMGKVGEEEAEAFQLATARYLAARLSSEFDCEARVVKNLQSSVAVYNHGALDR